jgi:hypothetical protein
VIREKVRWVIKISNGAVGWFSWALYKAGYLGRQQGTAGFNGRIVILRQREVKKNANAPMASRAFWSSLYMYRAHAAGARLSIVRRGFFLNLLALGTLPIHRSGLEAGFFQPSHNLVLQEAVIRLYPNIGV